MTTETGTAPIAREDYAAIIKTILEVSNSIPSLAKAERNKYSNYNYVSIDEYYDKVAKVSVAMGLSWHMRETFIQHLHADDPKDRKDSLVVVSYAFDLIHANGAIWRDYDIITIYHPWQGAQTAGSARSYAEKCFMRTLFKVVTGEGEDADALPSGQPVQTPRQLPGWPAPPAPPTKTPVSDPSGQDWVTPGAGLSIEQTFDQGAGAQTSAPLNDPIPDLAPAKKMLAPPSEYADVMVDFNEDNKTPVFDTPSPAQCKTHPWALVVKAFEVFAPTCHTVPELTRFWTDNIKLLNTAKDFDRKVFNQIQSIFTTRKAELEAQAKR